MEWKFHCRGNRRDGRVHRGASKIGIHINNEIYVKNDKEFSRVRHVAVTSCKGRLKKQKREKLWREPVIMKKLKKPQRDISITLF